MSVTRSVSQVLPTFLGVLLLLLAGCSQNAQSGTPANPANPPADAPTALVYGMANNPVYEALKSRVRMTLWNETQQVTDFDLVILDGDGFGAQEIREDASIHSAVRAGVWVLGFDLEEDDKQDGLGYSLNAATPASSPAYLVRQTRRTDGHQLNTFIDFVNHTGTADEQAKQIVAYLTTAELTAQQYEPAVPA